MTDSNMVKIRPEVMRFAEAMEMKLQQNDYKGGWSDDSIYCLLSKLYEEIDEFNSTGVYQEMMEEVIDIANYAMMIYDNSYKRNNEIKIEELKTFVDKLKESIILYNDLIDRFPDDKALYDNLQHMKNTKDKMNELIECYENDNDNIRKEEKEKTTLTSRELELILAVIPKYLACETWGACAKFEDVTIDEWTELMEKLREMYNNLND